MTLILTPIPAGLNVRSGEGMEHSTIASVRPGDELVPLEDKAAVMAKLGQNGQWVNVRLPDGRQGWAAAWLVKLVREVEEKPPAAAETAPGETPATESVLAEPPAAAPAPPDMAEAEVILLTPTPPDGLSIRNGPGTQFDRLAGTLLPGVRLEALHDRATVTARVGVNGEWLNVRLADNRKVWVAAWLVRLVTADELPPPPPRPWLGLIEVPVARRALTLTPGGSGELNLRGGPDSNFAVVTVAKPGDPLEILESKETVAAKMQSGKNWVQVRTADGTVGWTAAWLLEVQAEQAPDWAGKPVVRLPDPAQVPAADDMEAGRRRALDFDHEPCFVRLPVCDPADVESFSGFGPNNFSFRIRAKDMYVAFARLHSGLDFGHPIGTKLCAMDWGVVVHVSREGLDYDNPYRAGPYSVIVRHGSRLVLYGHMNGAKQGTDMFVKVGDIVKPGDPLGLSGTFNQFPHLHIEMRKIPADHVERLRTLAEADGGDLLEGMDKHFRQRGLLGWLQPKDNWLNMAHHFNPPLEQYWDQYGWGHACSEAADNDNNGYVDHVLLTNETVPSAFDLYAITSIPPSSAQGYNFWAQSREV